VRQTDGVIDVDAVLSRLTIEDKIALVSGADAWHTATLDGVPPMRCSDGPAGVRGTSWQGPASASFPCGTALGATFDPALVEQVGRALGREARSKSAHVVLAPTVNLHRTPIGGRNFECMSEDPLLTSRITVGYVRGLQSERVAACIKHFVGNDTEFERMTISSDIDEVTLREVYLAPFEAAVAPLAGGGAAIRSIMTGYNRLDGVFCSEHETLLRRILRDEWGFDGVLVSDWYGTHSTAPALEAGLDLEMPGVTRFRGEALARAIAAGEVGVERLDESARRLLALISWTGAGDGDGSETTDDAPETRAVIRAAATAATVLLRNDGVLPLAPAARVALIGPNAVRPQFQGGGSARVRPHAPVGIVAALEGRGVDLTVEQGCSIDKRLPVLHGDFAVIYSGADGATAEAAMDALSIMVMDDPAEGIAQTEFGASVSGSFVPDRSGDWEFGMTAVGSAVLRVDGEVVVDLSVPQTGGAFFGVGSPELRATVALSAGVPCEVEVDYPIAVADNLRAVEVGAAPVPVGDGIAAAAAIAAAADVAVVVVGTNPDWETEGEDRTTMDLPGDQDALVAAVAAANPRTIVVVNAGSPVAMPWADDVAAVLQVWFPGEELGNSLCDVLFGDADPGGRLPVTVPYRLADTPAFPYYPGAEPAPGDFRRAVYGEGLLIGHRWYDATGVEPRFPFGHGLSYATFELGEPATSTGGDGAVTGGDGAVTVSVPVRNTSERPGTEVVQVYVEPVPARAGRPVRTLRGFAKMALAPGEAGVAVVTLDRRAFAEWDPSSSSWVTVPGDHVIHLGRSSRDLPRSITVTVSVTVSSPEA